MASKVFADVVVIDISSSYIKAGWAGEDTPRCVIPAVLIANPTQETKETKSATKLRKTSSKAPPAYLIGEAALSLVRDRNKAKKSTEDIKLVYPVRKGRIVATHWDAMIHLLRHIFVEELRVGPHPKNAVLVTQAPMVSEGDRRTLAQKLFTEFRLPGLCIANRGTMALFDSGNTTGIALVVGGNVSYAVPVYEGFALPHATLSTEIAGDRVTEMFRPALKQFGVKQCDDESWDPVLSDIRSQSCFVLDYELKQGLLKDFFSVKSDTKDRMNELDVWLDPTKLAKKIADEIKKDVKDMEVAETRKKWLEKLSSEILKSSKRLNKGSKPLLEELKKRLQVDDKMLYEIPIGEKGEIIPIHDILRFLVPEALFSPTSILGRQNSQLGLQDLVYRSIKMCDSFLEAQLIKNIVIAGEITEIPGFCGRLGAEVKQLCEGADVRVTAEPRGKDASWRGGSMYATLPTFDQLMFTRENFAEDEQLVVKRYF